VIGVLVISFRTCPVLDATIILVFENGAPATAPVPSVKLFVPIVRLPLDNVSTLLTAILFPSVVPPALLIVRLLKVVVALPPIANPLPFMDTVPLPAVNVAPLLVKLPVRLRFVFAVNVPAVKIEFPVTDIVAGAVKLPKV